MPNIILCGLMPNTWPRAQYTLRGLMPNTQGGCTLVMLSHHVIAFLQSVQYLVNSDIYGEAVCY